MAYDAYQNGSAPYSQMGNANQMNPNEYRPTSYSPPYPSQYGPERLNMPHPQVPPAPPTNPYPESLPQVNHWQHPPDGRINDAVNSAFHKADTTAYLSPDVLSQITANVIQQLKGTGLENVPSDQYQPPQPPPRPPKQWAPGVSPSFSNEFVSSPSMATQDASASSPHVAYEHATYQPRPSSTGYAGSPHLQPKMSPVTPLERRGSPASQMSDHSQRMDSRPKPPSRDATVTELTTLEKIWGKFFEDGKPTERLSQFLRGIAVHLIEDYPPPNTLVVTPKKLQKFYDDTKVSSDPYPWQDIFDDRTSSISRLFREIEAEHHLVQEDGKLNERPDLPGLTPRGFERWATLMIQAHPEREYKRLQKAVLNMPISNPDNRKERFPKEIPRRLFPEAPNLPLREEMNQYIMRHCGVDLPPVSDEEVRKENAPRESSTTSATEATPSFSERERKPYQASVSAVLDDEDEDEDAPAPARPIERQRKPYSAQPGGGKKYDEAGEFTRRHRSSFSTGSFSRDGPAPPSPRLSEPQGLDSAYSRASTAQRPMSTVDPSRSPSRGAKPGGDYRHSESDLLGHNGSLRYTGTDHYPSSSMSAIPGDIIEDSRRYRDASRDENHRLYETLREREREREKNRYQDYLPQRSSWAGDEDYYRSALGSKGGSVSGDGYDYKTFGY
ncbi:hypothetical protein BDV25DRAFT_133778 [Aspergillus avenaceus]|uniref:DUF7514 domain-containing protein n=1 Tax=Aspergillus avenaceus TaxID=36643 RepID=A0A5N6TGE0_ASPAV|nr:hypothetical protein BDV25DRAFT_133778 [Aspergillus avenaceus]